MPFAEPDFGLAFPLPNTLNALGSSEEAAAQRPARNGAYEQIPAADQLTDDSDDQDTLRAGAEDTSDAESLLELTPEEANRLVNVLAEGVVDWSRSSTTPHSRANGSTDAPRASRSRALSHLFSRSGLSAVIHGQGQARPDQSYRQDDVHDENEPLANRMSTPRGEQSTMIQLNDMSTSPLAHTRASDGAMRFFVEERQRLRHLVIRAVALLSLISAVTGVTLYFNGSFDDEKGAVDLSSRTWALYVAFLIFNAVLVSLLLMAYGVRIAELHMNATVEVETAATAQLLERYRQHRRRQIRRMQRRSHRRRNNGDDDDEMADGESDTPLAQQMAYERRRLNRRRGRGPAVQRQHQQQTLDVDPTLLAPPPPTYAEASMDPPAYDTIKDILPNSANTASEQRDAVGTQPGPSSHHNVSSPSLADTHSTGDDETDSSTLAHQPEQ
ncbi:hypothetical protein THASP1DRAFT_29013 [Thamnocephalis sphaerospora]|uniref:Transmembrane protein n=1 Tax=Thamnocephalis sphaerospora TaxID=78915 RepID=A0A4P9XUD3_9FUNG|nr:hypothetical protein THASP1DRAFT_29013 [Thamnocephalis sphaerospora]|eukprot:RKP09191.1 hypothetical protein THASP1DRAFT_29013 [Thamnocephalis sphaerospora]